MSTGTKAKSAGRVADTRQLRIALSMPSTAMAMSKQTYDQLLSALDELDELRRKRDHRKLWKRCPICHGIGTATQCGMHGVCAECKGEGEVRR